MKLTVTVLQIKKQASYYKQEYNQRGQIKPLNAIDLRKTFNAILSNYDTCTNQMKLVVNSIALSLNEITQTDGQTCGIFRHVSRNDVNEEYTMEQMLNIMTKHNNSFLPTKGAFNRKTNDLIHTN